jgi:hypothetical protein
VVGHGGQVCVDVMLDVVAFAAPSQNVQTGYPLVEERILRVGLNMIEYRLDDSRLVSRVDGALNVTGE